MALARPQIVIAGTRVRFQASLPGARNGLSRSTSVIPCHYHSTIAPNSFNHPPPTLYNVLLPVLQFSLSVPFHHCSILIHPSTTHAVCFSPSTPGFPCQYHSTIAPFSFIHLPPTLYNVFLLVLQFSSVSIIPPLLHTHSFTYTLLLSEGKPGEFSENSDQSELCLISKRTAKCRTLLFIVFHA